MTPLQNLHTAIGELAYAIARADGKIQRSEAAAFLHLVTAELDYKNYDFDVSEIIFNIMTKDKMDIETAYNWAMKEIQINSHYLSPGLKKKFISVMEEIARAYPPVTDTEKIILERFKKEIAPVHGDPVYYGALDTY
jgi:uncharacterized tellurite resistance protein B-like protein